MELLANYKGPNNNFRKEKKNCIFLFFFLLIGFVLEK